MSQDSESALARIPGLAPPDALRLLDNKERNKRENNQAGAVHVVSVTLIRSWRESNTPHWRCQIAKTAHRPQKHSPGPAKPGRSRDAVGTDRSRMLARMSIVNPTSLRGYLDDTDLTAPQQSQISQSQPGSECNVCSFMVLTCGVGAPTLRRPAASATSRQEQPPAWATALRDDPLQVRRRARRAGSRRLLRTPPRQRLSRPGSLLAGGFLRRHQPGRKHGHGLARRCLIRSPTI